MTFPIRRKRLGEKDATLIVDDSPKYRPQEPEVRAFLQGQGAVQFYYSDYENFLIRLLHRTPGIGNAMSHIMLWAISFATAAKILFLHTERRKLFINPIVGLFYCALSRIVGREEHIGLAGLLFAHKNNRLYLRLRKEFTQFCCGKAAMIFVYSRSELAEYSKIFPAIASKLKFVPYGRNYDVFRGKAYDGRSTSYLASGGITNRDFNTLALALNILQSDQFPVTCTIATRPGHEPIQTRPPGLNVRYDIRIDQFGDFLKHARLVILPLKRTQLSSGHMVLLEAMSYGKPIIVADTPAVRDYVGPDTVVFYEPEDPADLARKIRFSLENLSRDEITLRASRGHSLYWSTYRHSNLVQRLLGELRERIHRGGSC